MGYYRNISIVDIKDWELGLQDAFEFEDGTRMERNATMNPERKKKLFKRLYPLVQTGRGFQKVLKRTDKIATRLNGSRFILTEEEYKEYYHQDSGMFKPSLDRHAEFEYVVQKFGKLRSELKVLKEGLNNMDSPDKLEGLQDQISRMVRMSESFTQNLKSEAKDFTDRIKKATCNCN